MANSNLVAGLNDEQLSAVTAPPENQLILAGAGSGKTRVLVHRIAWLIREYQVSPHQILAVTFTNKAAKEMKTRIESLLNIDTRALWIGTFHGLAHRLLKLHWQSAKLIQNFQIIDADDQLRMIKRIIKQLNVDDERWPPKEVVSFINGNKDEGVRSSHLQRYGDAYRDTFIALYSAYEDACEQAGVVDFAELLLRTHELFRDNTEIRNHYQERFRFVLVDEFQDTNAIQYAWLRSLSGKGNAMTAVGDDDQSIYGWRGARVENIHAYQNDFAPAVMYRLEQNYRSTKTILKAANAVIANNAERLGKELWSEGDEGDKILLYAAFNERDEAKYIVDQIQSSIKSGNRPSDLAVLYRSNAQSRVLEEVLLQEQVPYRIYGGQRFYDRLEIKNAMAYLRLVRSNQDDTAFERVINVPPRGIGAKTVEQIRYHAREQGCSMYESAITLANSGLSSRAANSVKTFVGLIESYQASKDSVELHELIDHILETSNLLSHHKNEKGGKGEERSENLAELVSAARVFEADEDKFEEFIDSAALDAGEAQADEYESAVQLMTLHSAKGLEFPKVWLSGVERNIFPHRMSAEDPSRLEEERRLCYVGITRAEQQLTITYAESRRLHGKEDFNGPSAFLKEIPSDCLSEVRLKTEIRRPAMTFAAPTEDLPEGIGIGKRIYHDHFGEGVILDIEGADARTRVQISFDWEGTKWLMLSHANIKPIE